MTFADLEWRDKLDIYQVGDGLAFKSSFFSVKAYLSFFFFWLFWNLYLSLEQFTPWLEIWNYNFDQ